MSKKAIFVIGATATGKSKLSIQLAKRLNGEIVSADSMQVYRQLDIASAKVPLSAREGVEHHMVSVVAAGDNFNVHIFAEMAKMAVEDIRSRHKMPIIAGGTFYYCEALMYENYLCPNAYESVNAITKTDDKITNHEKLRQIDPEMAKTLHPNNDRKIAASLNHFYATGVRHSESLKSRGGPRPAPGAQALLLWLRCDAEVLKARIDRRVRQMVRSGLVEEVCAVYQKLAPRCDGEKGPAQDWPRFSDRGTVFQCIGVKQLEPFFKALFGEIGDGIRTLSFGEVCEKAGIEERALKDVEMIEKRAREETKQRKMAGFAGKKLFGVLFDAIERMKLNTFQYSKTQTKWIRKRFLGVENVFVVGIDATEIEKWDTVALGPALKASKDFIDDKCDFSKDEWLKNANKAETRPFELFRCEKCGVTVTNENEKEAHYKSKRHRKAKVENSKFFE